MHTTHGFAVIGDSHLVADRDPLRVTNAEDALFALEQAVRFCLSQSLPLVLAGDLFDSNLVRSSILKDVSLLLAPLATTGLYGIQGNHDKDPTTPWFTHVPGAQRLTSTPTVVGGHRLVGLDFAPSAGISAQLAALTADADGLVLHQALRQGLGFDGAWNCDLDWVGIRDVWAGDLHNVRDELWSTDGKVRAVYTGSQYMTKTDESEFPSMLVVGPPNPGGHASYRRHPLLHRPIIRTTISSDADLAVLVDSLADLLAQQRPDLPPGLQRPGIIARYYSDVRGVGEVLREVTEGGRRAPFIEQPLPSRDRSFATCQMMTVREGLTLERLIGERATGDARAFAIDLAKARTASDVQQVITTWRERLINNKETMCIH
jgi:hypothetical protein